MKTMEEVANAATQINEAEIYSDVISRLEDARTNETPIDEGLFKAIFGGLAGATAGPAIMRSLCHVLGVDEKGTFGSLLTSRLILTALGAKLGWKS